MTIKECSVTPLITTYGKEKGVGTINHLRSWLPTPSITCKITSNPYGVRLSRFQHNPYAIGPLSFTAACAAARRAIGTRNGEHET
jgi:hypothetical protein